MTAAAQLPPVSTKRSSRRGVVSTDGIRLADGRLVYPGLSNTFENYELIPWISRHKSVWLGALLLVFGLVVTVVKFDWSPDDSELDKLAVTVDFGDVVQPFKKKPAKPREEVDEVFGNEFIKDKTPPDPNKDDPRIATAVNAAVGGATMPVDLSPEVRPQYTAEARSAGIEGAVTLEIVIAEDGKVLRAKPVGKKLGMGLDEAAARTYKAQRFKPSIGPPGKPIVVKYYERVRFVLN
ncbi:MAG: TonB family protein [Leptospiraceae bacterium]|nr:TonB family protein [Leptospiraceae bacterium]